MQGINIASMGPDEIAGCFLMRMLRVNKHRLGRVSKFNALIFKLAKYIQIYFLLPVHVKRVVRIQDIIDNLKVQTKVTVAGKVSAIEPDILFGLDNSLQ